MTSLNERRFVLFPLGEKRFALPAEHVSELARPDELQTFPHATPLLTGVLVRRGTIVPVCDIAQILIGNNGPARKFYLIASRQFGNTPEPIALPVTGECELVAAEMVPPTSALREYIVGLLPIGTEIIEVVDLEKLVGAEVMA